MTAARSPPFDMDMPSVVPSSAVVEDLYELQTLHRGSRLDQNKWTPEKMAATKREKKTSLTFKERFFGGKKNKKVGGTPNAKYDVVRNVDIVDGGGGKPPYSLDFNDVTATLRPTVVRGHKLEVHSKTTWCDSCEELIWGMSIQAYRCQHCKFTVHTKCVPSVYLECPEAPSQKSQEDIANQLEVLAEQSSKADMENNNLPSFVKSITELRRIIDEYNKQSNHQITLKNDYTFDGFIRVHMNLARPVNVNTDVTNLTLKKAVGRNKGGPQRKRRPVTEIFPDTHNNTNSSSNHNRSSHNDSSNTILGNVNTMMSGTDSGISSLNSNESFSPPTSPSPTSSPLSPVDMNTTVLDSMYTRRRTGRRLSFYMPKGTYKPLHVTSTTTVKEVIGALLSKYNVTDNPRKYCLFEKHKEKNEDAQLPVTFRRLKDTDKPLILMLSWGATNNSYSFVMKEDEGGNIEWLNFEIPELNNFLKILQEEEDKLIAQVYDKYERYREALDNAMTTHPGRR